MFLTLLPLPVDVLPNPTNPTHHGLHYCSERTTRRLMRRYSTGLIQRSQRNV